MMKKIVRNLVFALLGLILIALLAMYLIYPVQYVNRVLRWRKSDVYDYQKFPARPVEAAATPLPFGQQLAEDAVINEFEAIVQVEDFEGWLAENRTQAFIVIQGNDVLY